MTSRFKSAILLTLIAGLFLAACGTAPFQPPAVQVAPLSKVEIGASPTSTVPAKEAEEQLIQEVQFWVEQVRRVDEQGEVVVEITPMNLNSPAESLVFQVSLNTHSVDLSMDLAALSTLETDAGKTVQATQWEAPSGGHHVSGKLFFPATVDGVPLLNGVTRLTLTVVNLDVPERVFIWEK